MKEGTLMKTTQNRILSALLALICLLSCFALASCDENTDTDDSTTSGDAASQPQTDDSAQTEAPGLLTETYDYAKFINKDTLSYYCNTNSSQIEKAAVAVTGIVVELPGLGGSSCLGGSVNRGDYATAFTNRLAKAGIVIAYIFPGPWSWGSKAAVRMTDAVVAALADLYHLGEDFPLVVCGGSMGGLGALNYAADSQYKVSAVAAACPCTDVLESYDALPDFPRTFASAVASYDMPLEEALKQISPIEKLDDMPNIPYFICSDGEDECFPEELCDRYVDKMFAKGLTVTYYQQPGLTHGAFMPLIRQAFDDFILEHAQKNT